MTDQLYKALSPTGYPSENMWKGNDVLNIKFLQRILNIQALGTNIQNVNKLLRKYLLRELQ